MPADLPDWTSISVMTETAIPNSPFSIPRDGGTHNITPVNLPLGCQWLVIATDFAIDIQSILVTGLTTNIVYGPNSQIPVLHIEYVRVHPAIDASVTIAIQTANTGGNATVGIAFGFSPTTNDLDPLVASGVFLTDSAAIPLAIDSAFSGVNRAGVSLANALPAVWQAGNKRVGIPATSVAASGTLTVLAGVANQHIYPGRFSFSEDAANAAAGGRWVLQDSAGGTIHDMLTGGARGTIDHGTLDGEPLGSGLGVQLKNLGANASFVAGFLAYQQF